MTTFSQTKKKIDLRFEVRIYNTNIDTMTTQQQDSAFNAVKGELKKSNGLNRFFKREINERDKPSRSVLWNWRIQ